MGTNNYYYITYKFELDDVEIGTLISVEIELDNHILYDSYQLNDEIQLLHFRNFDTRTIYCNNINFE